MPVKRGAFILLEGCDNTGKSTQCRKLSLAFQERQIAHRIWCFPNRDTRIGSLLDSFLRRDIELDGHTAHLLFSANRWEVMDQMRRELESGTTLIVDRYSLSGVVYSSLAPGVSIEWSKATEKGLLKPDKIFYLDMDTDVISSRVSFASERFELDSVQVAARKAFHSIMEEDWVVLDASCDENVIHSEILREALRTIAHVQSTTLPIQ